MTELSAETNPQILVNGEQQEQQQDDAAAAEEQISSISLDEESSEDNVAAEKEKHAKMQSVFQQVRHQIRSQVVRKDKKNSILELMKLVKEMETAHVSGEPEGEEVSSEEKKDDSKDETDPKQEEELCATFDKKLEDCKKALRAEFDLQICQARAEMRAYTDQALSGWKCETHIRETCSLQPKEQHEGKNPDRKQKPSAPPSLVSRRGRVLTRTMTTIIPKTCAPVIVGPRAKSETLSSSKAESSRLLQRDAMLHLSGNKPCQCRKPLLPPACPPLHQRKKPVGAKTKTGK